MNVFVVREIKDAFETVKDLEKIGVKSKSLPITKCNYKTIPNYKIKYDFILLTSAKSITIFIRFINLYKKIHNKIPKIFVVGIETANALKKNSYEDIFVSEGNSKSLSELVISNTKIYSKGLWLCGLHRKRVLKTKLLENKRFLKENLQVLVEKETTQGYFSGRSPYLQSIHFQSDSSCIGNIVDITVL